MKYTGSCHCGAVCFEAEGDVTQLIECNCSHCSRKGFLLWFVPRAQFNLKQGEGKTTIYRFNKHVIDHHFCMTCGCEAFAIGKDAKGNEIAAINMRCIDDVNLEAWPRHAYDGKHA